MTKIYTKTGDLGQTRIIGGNKIGKNSSRIEAYGNVDELNSLIGVILSKELDKSFAKKLTRIQKELFVLGSDLATPLDSKVKFVRISSADVKRLEKEIDSWENNLHKLVNFILPGGGEIGSKLHFARTIARRTERSIVLLDSIEKVNVNNLSYINRLSDWLFVLARFVNKAERKKETVWKSRN